MIYIAFTFWLFALLFVSRGILTLWTQMVKPKVVSWVILPGTLAAELAFYLASLICGAEFRPRKLVSENEGDEKAESGKASKGIPYLTPVVTGLLPVAAAMALILLLSVEFDHPVFRSFHANGVDLPVRLPLVTHTTIWSLLADQVDLMHDAWRSLADSLNNWPWQEPKAWVFEYLMICLILRLAPGRRPMRPALIGTAVLAAGTALMAAVFSNGGQWLHDLWPLISYTWATALLLLAVSLAVRGGVSLVRIFRGKE